MWYNWDRKSERDFIHRVEKLEEDTKDIQKDINNIKTVGVITNKIYETVKSLTQEDLSINRGLNLAETGVLVGSLMGPSLMYRSVF